MEYVIIGVVAIFASGLTLFSGFGLGTLLLPAFTLFFPVDVAIGMTAVVHLLNNIFKLFLLGKHANKDILLRFGLPAMLAAFLGAWALLWFSDLQPLVGYTLGNRVLYVVPVKLMIAVLIILFTFFEYLPQFKRLAFDKKYLPGGGLLSGFFGGLSGHQGALRSLFLLKCGLDKESFVATGVTIACFVDVSRLALYSSRYLHVLAEENWSLLLTAVISAFVGAYVGRRILGKITMKAVRIFVSIMLFCIAIGLGIGLI